MSNWVSKASRTGEMTVCFDKPINRTHLLILHSNKCGDIPWSDTIDVLQASTRVSRIEISSEEVAKDPRSESWIVTSDLLSGGWFANIWLLQNINNKRLLINQMLNSIHANKECASLYVQYPLTIKQTFLISYLKETEADCFLAIVTLFLL
jgi:hypothetical protein